MPAPAISSTSPTLLPGSFASGMIRGEAARWKPLPCPYDPGQSQVIEADLPSLRPMPGNPGIGNPRTTFQWPAGHVYPTAVQCLASPRRSSSASTGAIRARRRRPSPARSSRPAGSAPSARRQPSPPAPGPVQLVLRFPEDHTTFSQPLLATGRPKAGDLIFVRYLDNHRISLGYAHGADPSLVTRPIAIDYGATHAIELSLGSLYPPLSAEAWSGVPETRRRQALQTVCVSVDGQPGLLADQEAYPADRNEIAVGRDSIRAPDCEPSFTGVMFLRQHLPVDAALPPDIQDGIGAVRLTLRFPTGRPGRNEPLLVTGRTGAGDVLYVHYIDDRHVSLGYDHWNAGGPLSAPLAVDYAATHVIELSLGSALSPAGGFRVGADFARTAPRAADFRFGPVGRPSGDPVVANGLSAPPGRDQRRSEQDWGFHLRSGLHRRNGGGAAPRARSRSSP